MSLERNVPMLAHACKTTSVAADIHINGIFSSLFVLSFQSLPSVTITMDLGFGKENQVVGDAVGKALLQSSSAQEAALDHELQRYDSLLQDEDALEQLRRKRLAELKKQQDQRAQWKRQGHGVYQDLVDSSNVDVAKAFFEATKQSSRVIIHFYRPTTPACEIFHSHLSILATQHLETKFLRINVGGCDEGINGASFLVDKLGIVIMPTVVLVKDRRVVHHLHGFDELGGMDDFSIKTLAYVLSTHGVLNARDDEVPPPKDVQGGGINAIRVMKHGKIREGMYNDEYDSE